MNNLKQKMITGIKKGEIGIKRALLLASGVETEEQIEEYRHKISLIINGYLGIIFYRNMHAIQINAIFVQ